jgi:hypothetical protein
MGREIRIARTKNDIEQELGVQLQFLRLDCAEYDSGFEPAAKRIALALRVLLHHRGQSRALLHQLGLREGCFLDTAGSFKPPDNYAPEFKLLAIEMTFQAVRFLPLVAVGSDIEREQMVPFDEWWTEPVLKDSKGNRFSRSDLVLHVADADGGAHVDPDFSEAYMALSRQNSIGGTYQKAGVTVPIEGKPELGSIRRIAHEVLSTLHSGTSRFSAEAVPVIPTPREAMGKVGVIVGFVEICPRLDE